MSSRHVQIADAVTSLLNDAAPGTFSIAFTAQRVWLPRAALAKDFTSLRVEVMPMPIDTSLLNRSGDWEDQIRIGVLVRRKVSASPSEEIAECDAVDLVSEQIRNHLSTSGIGLFGGLSPDEIELTPLFDGDRLDAAGIFSSSIAITYRVPR